MPRQKTYCWQFGTQGLNSNFPIHRDPKLFSLLHLFLAPGSGKTGAVLLAWHCRGEPYTICVLPAVRHDGQCACCSVPGVATPGYFRQSLQDAVRLFDAALINIAFRVYNISHDLERRIHRCIRDVVAKPVRG